MPVEIGIMMKFSEVINDGGRWPKNFYDQLRRCSDLLPINVLATINNRWIIRNTAEGSWEEEFLSDRIANKARQYRRTLDRDGFIFTRAGSLLNLKLLLGMQPPSTPYERTAIGAISLHANDYVESDDTSSLAVGTLPVIAELTPFWELQNIRDPRQLLFRSYYLYTLLQTDERMQSLFNNPIADITFGGLGFAQYFSLLFGMYTNVSNGVVATPYPTSILDGVDIAAKAHVTTDDFTTFARAKALTLDEARQRFGPLDHESFLAQVTSSRWTSNQLAFRDRPLLALPDGRFLALDLQFLFENASAGLPWTLAREVPEERRKQFLDRWGDLFEQYGQALLAHYYPGQAPVEKKYDAGQIDALLVSGSDVMNIEIKAGFIRDDVKGARDQALLDAALRKKYVTDAKGRRVGVSQLAASSMAILEGRVPNVTAARVFPVLIGEDPILQTLAMNTYLDDIFRTEASDQRIMPLTVMLVDELEELLPHLRAGDMSWQEFLSRRFINGRASGEPVHTTFSDIANERRFKRRNETFLATVGEELIAMIKDAYKDLV